MAFRASTPDAAIAYNNIKQQARNSKTYLTNQRAAMQQATCDSAVVVSTIQHFSAVIANMAIWAATPGLTQYARDQENDQAYDVVAEYNAMNTAMVNARDSLISMFPTQGGSGYLLYQTMDAQGRITTRSFTSAQLVGAVTLLTSVIGTIG